HIEKIGILATYNGKMCTGFHLRIGMPIDRNITVYPLLLQTASFFTSIGRNPKFFNICISSSTPGFGVTNKVCLSPVNIELAPAIKHQACSSSFISILPALNLTIEEGSTILAVAIILTISQVSILGRFSNGVPATLAKALIGTDSGCFSIFAKVRSIEILSSAFSPNPIIPPEQTVMPAFLTFLMVSILLSNFLVEIISS